uniref:Zinc finger protein, FOG family member 1 n=1 Tax=Neolamprologus brichardi TaxID=32507 RepID=A0A3Q4FY91_NEOBR
MTVVCEDPDCWISRLPLTSDASAANCSIYSQGDFFSNARQYDIYFLAAFKIRICVSNSRKLRSNTTCAFYAARFPVVTPSCLFSGEDLFCKVMKELTAGERLVALVAHKQPVVKEEPSYPAALHSEIQLLPQQAGMAAILATAVVNKDIFPCKDCGIWYRSERNLQAHLMYYCASRQKQPAAASSPPQDKPKESYPNERICPFPQCNKSCPSASSLEIHMRTHSGERPFVCLICLSAFTTKANCERHLKVHTDTLNGVCHGCGFVSTTRDILYSHLVTSHMVCQPGSRSEVYSPGPGLPKLPLSIGKSFPHILVPAERSPTPRQSTPSSVDHSQPSPPEKEPLASSSPGTNGGSATPRDCKEVDQEAGRNIKEVQTTSSSQTSNSPKSPATTTVKAEPTSPTPGSSPAHMGGAGSVVPGGALFLPQYMFNPEAAILPQASEILAKMSEMVHSRLKQGQTVAQNNAAAFFPSGPTAPTATATPPHKGATCFECDITFNNINNFYAHKRLYCSSRHQGEGASSASGAALTRDAASAAAPSAGTRGSSASPQGGASREGAGTSVGGGGGGRASEGSQSPASGSTEDLDDDPNRTFCEACNIRFSRHDNYTVHKRFYCASRHDPSNQRAVHMAKTTNTAAFIPQPIRTRKRKKMYEIHMARTEALANAAAAEVSPSGAGGSSPEGDGPIDLSKRPRLRDAPRHGGSGGGSSILPALPLTDYHKCTACSISFNSIENYLAHKTYYCPMVCPYCPNRPIAGDLMEHFKTTHGLVVTIQPPQETLPHLGRTASRSPSLSPRDGAAQTAASHAIPVPSVSPKTTPVISPVQNGNSRFCRLCNIKFSSLSTFIAHKKYYCSSHSAEHVK